MFGGKSRRKSQLIPSWCELWEDLLRRGANLENNAFLERDYCGQNMENAL